MRIKTYLDVRRLNRSKKRGIVPSLFSFQYSDGKVNIVNSHYDQYHKAIERRKYKKKPYCPYLWELHHKQMGTMH